MIILQISSFLKRNINITDILKGIGVAMKEDLIPTRLKLVQIYSEKCVQKSLLTISFFSKL